jgi:hypothetical protein
MRSKQIGFALIACASIASVFLLGCERRNAEPKPSPVVRTFVLEDGPEVTEFRDSAGRICVFVYSGRGNVLSCARPLPPLEYEHLPELAEP